VLVTSPLTSGDSGTRCPQRVGERECGTRRLILRLRRILCHRIQQKPIQLEIALAHRSLEEPMTAVPEWDEAAVWA